MKTVTANKARNNGKPCYRVQVPEDQRELYKITSRFFPFTPKGKEDAEQFAKAINTNRQSWSAQLMALPEATHWRLLVLLEKAGGIDQLEARSAGEALKEELGTMLLSDAIETHCSSRKKSATNETNARRDLLRLSAFVGAKATVASVTPDQLDLWLAEHGTGNMDKGLKPHAPNTVRQAYVRAVCFFRWAKARRFIAHDPTEAITACPEVNGRKLKLSPVQTLELLSVCRRLDPDLLPYFALPLFCGLRSCEVERLYPECWRPGTPLHVHLGEDVAKKGYARTIPVLPTAQEWLNVNSTLQWGNLRRRRAAILGALSFPFPDNSPRHSFCSYHAAQVGYGSCAVQAGNSESRLRKFYVDSHTLADSAAQYFACTPGAVDQWEATRSPVAKVA